MTKNLVSGLIFAHFSQIRAAILFLKNLASSSLDIMVSYHHVHYQKKLMIQCWENLVTDKRTDRQQTDESDFIGRYPTNVERPKSVFCIL